MKTFNSIKFLNDHDIIYYTEGKNVSPGWVSIQCPLCDDRSNHGGFNKAQGYYSCFKCGTHTLPYVIHKLLNISVLDAKSIIKEYQSHIIKKKEKKRKIITKIKFPDNTIDLQNTHKKYLIKRKFNPEKLIKEFKLKGTNHRGNYRFRIIAPILLNNRMVSYQGRDITNKHTLRYKACKKELEIIEHKHTLYNIDNIKNRKAIIVEGITDVWRLGHGSIALFGTQFTNKQIKMIIDRLDIVYIILDKGAEEQADKLNSILNNNIKSYIVEIPKMNDPGSMLDKDALTLKKELIGE